MINTTKEMFLMNALKLTSTLAAVYLLSACALTGCGGGGGSSSSNPVAQTSSAPTEASSSSSTPASSSSSSTSSSSSSSQTTSAQSSANSSVILGAAITAKQAASTMGKGFNLGQMFDNTQNPRTLAAAKAKIDAYYAQGFRNVRIPITWTEKVDGTTLVNDITVGDVNRTHPRLLVIADVIDYALSLDGMYVVINAHHESALKDNNRAAVLERIWQDAADIFRNRNHRLLFEILNEPHLSNNSAMDPSNLRNMTGKAYKKIRAVDAERIVIIGGNQWFGANEMANTWPNLNDVGAGLDQYLMAEFHHYNPWSFNGDNQGDYADNWTEADIYNPMDTMLNWSNSVGKGMPVYIGEWGTGWGSRYTTFSCNNIRQFYQKLDAKYASTKGMPTAVWDDGGWFKIFDFTSYSFSNNLSQCIGGTCEWDGTERFNSGCL